VSNDEIPYYDDPHPDPAAERINAECQARIDAHYSGKAEMHNHWMDELPGWASRDTGAITVRHRTRAGRGIIAMLLEVVK
jgi:hypothetical protein